MTRKIADHRRHPGLKPPVALAAPAYPGVPITKAEYERMIHEMIVATVSSHTIQEAAMGTQTV